MTELDQVQAVSSGLLDAASTLYREGQFFESFLVVLWARRLNINTGLAHRRPDYHEWTLQLAIETQGRFFEHAFKQDILN